MDNQWSVTGYIKSSLDSWSELEQARTQNK